MNTTDLNVRVGKLLHELDHIRTFEELYKLAKTFHHYRVLMNRHQGYVPSALIDNIPFIGGDIEIARIYDQPKLVDFYFRSAHRKLRSDLEMLVGVLQQSY